MRIQFGYTLESYYAQAGYPVSLGVFVPVKEINTTQSDLSLLFLAPNSIRFAAQVDDPVFSAHEYVASSVPFYLADYVSYCQEAMTANLVSCISFANARSM